MAYVSHLPQVVASTLLETVGATVGENGLALSGPGLADTTRLAASPGGLWAGILAANADHVAEAMASLEAALGTAAGRARRRGVGRDDVRLRGALAARHQAHRRGRSPADLARRGAARADRAGRPHVPRADGRRCPRRRPGRSPAGAWPASSRCPATFYRYLYREVGRPWHWIRSPAVVGRAHPRARRQPGHRDLAAHARHRAGRVRRARARERRQRRDRLLRAAARLHRPSASDARSSKRSWDAPGSGGTTRVWLHTCTLDHPRALTNYLAGGFRVVREEAYTARLETVAAR